MDDRRTRPDIRELFEELEGITFEGTLGNLDLDEEDEAILDRAWARLAAEEAMREQTDGGQANR